MLGFTAENLLRLAVVVNELESRGEDLQHLRIGLLPLLRQIASGKLLPEAVVTFAGQPALLKRIAAMPLSEQKQVVERGTLPPPEPKPRPDYKNQHSPWKKPEGEDERGLPAVRNIALRGSEKDVAEMVVELLTGGDRPLGVFRETLRLLRGAEIKARTKEERQAVASLKAAAGAALKELEKPDKGGVP